MIMKAKGTIFLSPNSAYPKSQLKIQPFPNKFIREPSWTTAECIYCQVSDKVLDQGAFKLSVTHLFSS